MQFHVLCRMTQAGEKGHGPYDFKDVVTETEMFSGAGHSLNKYYR